MFRADPVELKSLKSLNILQQKADIVVNFTLVKIFDIRERVIPYLITHTAALHTIGTYYLLQPDGNGKSASLHFLRHAAATHQHC